MHPASRAFLKLPLLNFAREKSFSRSLRKALLAGCCVCITVKLPVSCLTSAPGYDVLDVTTTQVNEDSFVLKAKRRIKRSSFLINDFDFYNAQ